MNSLLTAAELAEALSVSLITIRKWTSQRRIPFLKIGKAVRYDSEAVQKWLTEKAVRPVG